LIPLEDSKSGILIILWKAGFCKRQNAAVKTQVIRAADGFCEVPDTFNLLFWCNALINTENQAGVHFVRSA